LICKLWVSGGGLASDWQARESDRCQPVLEKQRRIECGDFSLAGVIRTADARTHAGCNSRDTIGASSIASSGKRPNVSGPNDAKKYPNPMQNNGIGRPTAK
jgi:hypothetical protein